MGCRFLEDDMLDRRVRRRLDSRRKTSWVYRTRSSFNEDPAISYPVASSGCRARGRLFDHEAVFLGDAVKHPVFRDRRKTLVEFVQEDPGIGIAS